MSSLVRTLASCLVMSSVVSLVGVDSADAEAPRYQLEVGQKLTYETSKFSTMPKFSHESSGTWTLWVVDGDAAGPWQVIARARTKQISIRNGERKELWDKVWYGAFEVAADGQATHAPNVGTAIDPGAIFVRLPADDAEMKAGWAWRSDTYWSTYDAEMTMAAVDDELVRFAVKRERITDPIYLVERASVVAFDPEVSLVRSIDSTSTKTWGTTRQEEASLRLVNIEEVPAATLTQLTDETRAYFDLVARYDDITKAARADLDTLDAKLAVAKQLIVDERNQFAMDDIVARIDEMIDIHDPRTNYHRDRATRRAALVGKPAPDWTLPDLDGVTHSLADERGKVVLLDFWYRGCTWCVRSMPQLKEVVETFTGEDVVFYGVNTDKVLDDAKFVVDAMGLNYASLQGPDLPKAYQVRAFPTLIIIDQAGIVREVHVGYTGNLGASIIEEVRELLEEDGSAG